jgi:glycosyltransferase involved in cell wall biosynthesis
MAAGPKKVLIITYYWPPSGGAGVQRWLKFCKYLPDWGIETIVLTVNDNEASYPVRDESLCREVHPKVKVVRTSTFEPFDFYLRLTGKKQVPFAGFANEKKGGWLQTLSRFIRGNLFIPDARKGWNRYALKAAMTIIKEQGIDTVITTSPPHSTQLIGLKLKKLTGIRWMADLRDPWTDIYYYREFLHSKAAAAKDARYEKSVLEHADEVIVVSDEMKRLFLNKYATLSASKIHVVYNGYDEDDFVGLKNTRRDNHVIQYVGTLAPNYPILPFARVLKKLMEHELPEVTMRFTGSVPESIKVDLTELLGNSVEFEGHVPHQIALERMCSAGLLLMIIADTPDNKGIITGKLFEYLASGNPILCLGPEDGDAARILSDCQAGNAISYENESSLEDFLLNVFREKVHLNLASHAEEVARYSRKKQGEKLLNIL